MNFSVYLSVNPHWLTYLLMACGWIGIVFFAILFTFVAGWAIDRVFRFLNRKGWM